MSVAQDLQASYMTRTSCSLEKNEADANAQLVTYSFYLKYFNLSFGYPKVDTCGTCDMFRVQLQSADGTQRVLIQNCKEQHLRSAEAFYSSLRTNTQLASINGHIRAISFENLVLPHVPVGEVFYMRQLCTYSVLMSVEPIAWY